MIDQRFIDEWLTDVLAGFSQLRSIDVQRLDWDNAELLLIRDDLNDLIARITKRAA